jgi:hypothetical protein
MQVQNKKATPMSLGGLEPITRPLQNAPFCPISVSGSNFNPQNTICIRACPVGPEDRTGWLKFSPSLNLNKIEHSSKVSLHNSVFTQITETFHLVK